MSAARARGAAWMVVVAMAVIVTMVPTAAQADGQQLVRAEDGLTAGGSVDLRFPDGTERHIAVKFVAPRGVVASTGGAGGLDIARPFVVVEETIVSDSSSEHRNIGTMTCSQVTNPDRWSTGSLTPSRNQWAGVTVDIRCPNSPFEVYHVRWNPAWVLVTDPVAVAWMAGPFANWSSLAGSGTVQLRPTARQSSDMTVCGVRQGRSQCATDRAAAVVPSTTGMTLTAVLG